MDVTVTNFDKYDIEMEPRDTYRDNKEKCVWVVPEQLCWVQFVNDESYLERDTRSTQRALSLINLVTVPFENPN